MESDSANMSKRDILRGIITERLSTAVREILAVVERTVADYEEEAADFKREIDRQKKLLELLQPEIKMEADDQQLFPLGDAGGGQLPEDWKQDKYEPSLEDSGSLGYQAPIEDDEFQYLEQEEEEDVTELDYPMASRLFPKTVQSKGRRKEKCQSSNPTDLNIRIIENSKIRVLSSRVYRKYPVQKLKVPHGLQEAEFLDLLKSTFPQLADEPFNIFFSGKHRKLKPLNVKSLTPEEFKRAYGDSTMVIRLQREDADEDADENPPSTPESISRVTADETTPTSHPLTETDTHINLKSYILEDPQMDMISPKVFQSYLPHELQVPRGLQEADFLALLRSTFPQLAAGEPFTILTAHGRKLKPLRIESVTAEEICNNSRFPGNPVIFIRLKGPEKDPEDPPSTSDRTTPNTDAMKPLDEDLRDIILRALPEISEGTQQVLIDKLISNGLESKQDLKRVTQEDIGDLLPSLQLQKFLEAFKNETELGTVDLQTVPSPSSLLGSPATLPCSTPSSDLPLSNQESSSSRNCRKALCRKEWTETFQVPWDLMPMEIQAAVAEGKRPSHAARKEMVRILVDEVRRYDLSPSRSQCALICKEIVRRYPQSFADLYDSGQVRGEGYMLLLNQVKGRISKLNSTKRFYDYCKSGMKRGSAYTYGRTRFKPSLPPEETNETVEQKRQRLEEIYCQDDANVAEKDEVTELMKVTFSMQRCQINTLPAPAIRDLRDRWPYLFTQNGLYTHFELLTDIKVLRNLEVAMEECGQTIMELFSESTNPDVQAILSLGPNHELSFCIIQLLMAHFTEALDSLILFANASATAADVEETLQLPATPRLILLAESPGSSIHRWMISLEGSVICEGIQPTFLSGLAAVFSTYYIFNLQYQANAACTLEFIQRRFIRINPDEGTEDPRDNFLSEQTGMCDVTKTRPINPQVLTLLNKIMDANLAVYTHTEMFPSLQSTSD